MPGRSPLTISVTQIGYTATTFTRATSGLEIQLKLELGPTFIFVRRLIPPIFNPNPERQTKLV